MYLWSKNKAQTSFEVTAKLLCAFVLHMQIVGFQCRSGSFIVKLVFYVSPTAKLICKICKIPQMTVSTQYTVFVLISANAPISAHPGHF